MFWIRFGERGKVREEDGGIRKGSMDLGGIHSFGVLERRFWGGAWGTDLAVRIYCAHRGLRGLGTEG